MNELLINGIDAYDAWGVRMGDSFIDTLYAPASLKDFIENESRLEHGKQIITHLSSGKSLSRLESRDISLVFTVEGKTPEDFQNKKRAFFAMLYEGSVSLQVPQVGEEVFHLVYSGKSSSFAQLPTMDFCKFAVKFIEPNPNNRK